MSAPLYHTDPYRRDGEALVIAHTPEGGIVLGDGIFFPAGGGQPGDCCALVWRGGSIAIATTTKGEAGAAVLVPAEPAALPAVGSLVQQRLDWDRRYRHMKMHTALHLLSVVIPLPVTGGQIGADKGRLDFDMPDPPADLAALERYLNELIKRDLPVTSEWITDAELAANPGLVKTMSVSPPVGQGRVRMVRIGVGDAQIDLQPCGGTHVARTAEIGAMRIAKVENKGKQNRRVIVVPAEDG